MGAIPIRVDITQNPDTRSISDIENAALTVRNNRNTVETADRADTLRQTLVRSLQRNSTPDPATGAVRTNHQAVAADLRRIDPTAADEYIQHVTAREQALTDRNMTLLRQALSSVDENGDQTVAQEQYQTAIQQLEHEGVAIDPSDRVYSRGRVAFWRRQAVGADKVFAEESNTARTAATQAGENYRHDRPSGNVTLEERGRNARWDRPSADNTQNNSERRYEHENPSGDTLENQSNENWRHVTQSPNHQGGGGDSPISFLNPGQNGGEASRGGMSYVVPDAQGRVSFLPGNVRTRVSSPPGPRTRPTRGASANHPGADYPAAEGTPILAEQTGEVIRSGPNRGLGNETVVRYADGSVIGYGHASRLYTRPGQRVTRGQPMAAVGQTGVATGPHVHRRVYSGPAAHAEADGPDAGTELANTEDMRAGREMVDANALTGEPGGSGYQPRAWRPSAAPAAPAGAPATARLAVNPRDAVSLVADGVQNYQGPSRLSQRGLSQLSRDPRIARVRATNVEQQISTLSQLQELLGNGELETGAGSGMQQFGRRALQGIDAITGHTTHLSNPENDRRVAAYEQLDAAGTIQAVEVLKGVGGNDTDRDFSRALTTAITGARSNRFNRYTAVMMRGTLELARDYANFVEQWASVTGSALATQDGVTLDQAWNHIAAPRRAAIMREARAAGSTSQGPINATAATNAQPRQQGHGSVTFNIQGQRVPNAPGVNGAGQRASSAPVADRGEGQFFRNQADGSIWQRRAGQLVRVH